MKNKLKNFAVLVGLIGFLYSCSFFSRNPEPTTQRSRGVESILLDYLNFTEQSSQADGVLKMFSSVGLPGQDFPTKLTDFTGFFRNSQNNFIHFADSMIVGNINIPIEEPNVFQKRNCSLLSNLYGSEISFKLKKDGQHIESKLYVPKLLRIQVETLPDNNTIAHIGVGTQISWNIDGKNTKGVVIVLRYSPEFSFGNIGKEYPNSIEKFIGVEDAKGNYIFTSKDLEGLPKGKDAHIDLIVGRMGANFYNFPNYNKTAAIYGYNIVTAKTQLK
jgi:hypothetical protein